MQQPKRNDEIRHLQAVQETREPAVTAYEVTRSFKHGGGRGGGGRRHNGLIISCILSVLLMTLCFYILSKDPATPSYRDLHSSSAGNVRVSTELFFFAISSAWAATAIVLLRRHLEAEQLERQGIKSLQNKRLKNLSSDSVLAVFMSYVLAMLNFL
jgi:hypothetical protein